MKKILFTLLMFVGYNLQTHTMQRTTMPDDNNLSEDEVTKINIITSALENNVYHSENKEEWQKASKAMMIFYELYLPHSTFMIPNFNEVQARARAKNQPSETQTSNQPSETPSERFRRALLNPNAGRAPRTTRNN